MSDKVKDVKIAIKVGKGLNEHHKNKNQKSDDPKKKEDKKEKVPEKSSAITRETSNVNILKKTTKQSVSQDFSIPPKS